MPGCKSAYIPGRPYSLMPVPATIGRPTDGYDLVSSSMATSIAPELVHEVDELLAGVDIQLLVERLGVRFHGVLRQAELLGGERHAPALGQVAHHLDLAL